MRREAGMFVGHYAAAFGLAAVRPKMPLWGLVLGVQALDVVWATLILAGVEQVRIAPGFLEASDLDLHFMPYSHGLPAALGWSVLFGVLWALWRKSRAEGVLIGLAVFSHWIADFVVHAPDLELWPGGPMAGLGLWSSLVLSQALEIGLLLVAAMFWVWRSKPLRGRAIALIAFMLVIQAVSHAPGMGPPSTTVLALQALFFYLLFAALAWLATRPRSMVPREQLAR
jgi:hypothetical protein